MLADRLRTITARAPAPIETLASRPKQRPSRALVFRNATITLDSGERMGVALKDVSDSGARIEFFLHLELPDVFTLSEPMMKLRRRARVVWARDGVAGIAFVD